MWHARMALRTLRLDQRQAIAEAETTTPFNHVYVRSMGPWGKAKGVRGALVIRRSSGVPGPRDPILPPLTGPLVPPLTGTLIPPLTGPTARPPGEIPPAVRSK